MIYIYMTLFSICFVYLSSVVEKSADLENISTKMVENVTFLIAFLIICVPGMIRYNVGIDYRTYSLGQIPDVLANEQVNLELLFKLLIKFGYWLTGGTSYQVIFALTNFIIDFFIFKYIKEQSKNLPLSLLIFMFGGFFAFSLSGMRQSIGVSIALYSIKYIYQKKPIRFVMLILLASLFHTSALIFVLFYIFRNVKINPVIILCLMTIVFLTSVKIRQIIIYFSSKVGLYSNYFGGMYDNGEFGYLFIILVFSVMFFICISYFVVGKSAFYKFNIEINIHYMACMIIAMISQLPTPSRMYFLFVPVYITLIPNMISLYKKIQIRAWLDFLVTLYACFFMYWNIFVQGAYDILPYHSIFNKY